MTAQQLKNAILQEAIEGRLVPQDPHDEPASVLLDKIHKEKARLVKEGKIYKKGETKPLYTLDNFPFDIPEGWEWCQLSDASIIQEGAGIRKYQYTQDGIQLLCVTNILDGNIDLSKKALHVSEKEYQEKYLHLTPQKGDIITACSGGSWGKISIFESDETVMLNTSTLRMRFFGDLAYNKYLYYIAQGKFFKDQLACQLVGIQPNFGYAHYSRICIPLPPLAEQKRIVEKIEELLPKVEAYGKAQESLDKLNEELPERLKKSILQEAISGRLVPQDPNDEPASVLLDKIRKEKARLVKEGKLKKKDLEEIPISEDEKPFEIPKRWEWCRVCDITDSYIGLTYKPTDVSTNGWVVLRSSNIQDGLLDYNDIVRVNMDIPEKLRVQVNDIIICARNGSKKLVGKSALVREVNEPTTFGAFMAICRTQFYEYMAKYLLSPLFFQQLRKDSDTTTINQLTQKNFNRYLVPLPPLAEQHRIVEKLEQVLGEIDKLKK